MGQKRYCVLKAQTNPLSDTFLNSLDAIECPMFWAV